MCLPITYYYYYCCYFGYCNCNIVIVGVVIAAATIVPYDE